MDAIWYKEQIKKIAIELDGETDFDYKIEMLNKLRLALHDVSTEGGTGGLCYMDKDRKRCSK
jgi:hypothetical protein